MKKNINKIKFRILLRDERGLSMVEFAIILPIFLILILGIIEFGVLLYDKAVLTDASREGAREAILYRSPSLSLDDINDIVKTTVKNYAENSLFSLKDGLSFDPEKITVLLNLDNDSDGKIDTGDILEVRVSYDFKFMLFSRIISLIGGSFENGITLESITLMRKE